MTENFGFSRMESNNLKNLSRNWWLWAPLAAAGGIAAAAASYLYFGKKQRNVGIEHAAPMEKPVTKPKPVILRRAMIKAESQDKSEDGVAEFTVMQWNALADWLCDPKAFPHAHSEQCLTWAARSETLRELISSPEIQQVDLMSMQEVDHWPDFFEAEFARIGLKGHFLKKMADDSRDGSVLLWRADMFDLLDIQELQLSEGQSQVAIFALLQHKKTGHPILFATTHLKAKEGFEERRAIQGFNILNKVDEIIRTKCAAAKKKPHIIICGDFNDTPDSLVAKIFNGDTIQTKYDHQLTSAVGALKSAYSAYPGATIYDGNRRDALYTTYKKRATESCRTIDYIWYANAEKEDSSESSSIIAPVALLEIPEIAKLHYRLPAEYYPSDHLAIACTFRMK